MENEECDFKWRKGGENEDFIIPNDEGMSRRDYGEMTHGSAVVNSRTTR